MNHKITIIGAGNIGSTVAHLIAQQHLGDVVLLDLNANSAKGKALDIMQAGALEGYDVNIIGTDNYADIEGSDVVVIVAGSPRKPGQSRDDLLNAGANVIRQVSKGVKQYAPNAFVIMVSNPLDVMTYLFIKETGWNRNMIIGQAGALDSGRLKLFLAKEFKVSVLDVQTMILGTHGDTMVPLMQYSTISGIPISELIAMDRSTYERVTAIIERAKNGGGEIVGLLGTSAYYAPSAAIVNMIRSYLLDLNRIIPSSYYLNGEYGYSDVCVGVPVVIGKGGVKEVVQLELTDEDVEAFEKSVMSVQELIKKIQ